MASGTRCEEKGRVLVHENGRAKISVNRLIEEKNRESYNIQGVDLPKEIVAVIYMGLGFSLYGNCEIAAETVISSNAGQEECVVIKWKRGGHDHSTLIPTRLIREIEFQSFVKF